MTASERDRLRRLIDSRRREIVGERLADGFLRAALAAGARDARDVRRAAKADGLGANALSSACSRLGVVRSRGEGRLLWSLPKHPTRPRTRGRRRA